MCSRSLAVARRGEVLAEARLGALALGHAHDAFRRWGTTTPSLGVPVSFPEIQRVSALCEIMRLGNVIPDVSLGSYFFNDLVEENMLYVAIFPGSSGYLLDEPRLRAAPNLLPDLCPNDADMAGVVRVIDVGSPGAWDTRTLWLNASCVGQEVRCYFAPPPPPEEAE